MKPLIVSRFIGVVGLAFSFSAFAANPAPKATTPVIHHTVISSISADSITVNTGKSTQTYKIDKHTQLMFDGKKVPMSDLKAGMRVMVTPDFDGKTASAINGGAPPKVAPAASPAPKK
ncbi:MAG: hypothetical protein WCO68_07275 [Verrucomicrobiota bacterium]